ncbi:hypothetical protein [Cyanobium gracile]|uniref:Uncharacterized protein n=1 Tax=Cyanobium gracile UHCC 0281 TaxID=3110309 RepID=A0ABU5SZY1_9CYAN|nr:hypothetical protein [Cyanobium gracile]MEA5444085.1 hypothetical protein [Cyanobium gracile UHCC 0281]
MSIRRSRQVLKPWACLARSPLVLPLLLAMEVAVGGGMAAPALAQKVPPQIPRDGWKDCEYNDKPLACVDQQIPGGLTIRWKDGQSMTYREVSGKGKDASGSDLLRDRLGGLWRRELYVQGNITLTNEANGNRIFVPLRFPCKPPLKGEVGYCRY